MCSKSTHQRTSCGGIADDEDPRGHLVQIPVLSIEIRPSRHLRSPTVTTNVGWTLVVAGKSRSRSLVRRRRCVQRLLQEACAPLERHIITSPINQTNQGKESFTRHPTRVQSTLQVEVLFPRDRERIRLAVGTLECRNCQSQATEWVLLEHILTVSTKWRKRERKFRTT